MSYTVGNSDDGVDKAPADLRGAASSSGLTHCRSRNRGYLSSMEDLVISY